MDVADQDRTHAVYEFGDFRLDAGRRLLFPRESPEALRIAPRVVEALVYLVEHREQLLGKDRLMAELWPGLVVEENSLTQLISALRRALGEAPGDNRYLATVPGRGYRFVAEVRRVSSAVEPAPRAQATSPAATSPAASRPRATITLLALASLFGAALFAWSWQARWWLEPDPAAPPVAPAAVELPAYTVAVLPFESLSADPADKHVAAGVAEGILHRLAGVRGLTLIARTSSFAFRDGRSEAREIGRALNARYLVQGSLQRLGDELRVTAQLIDASTGAHVWSLRFDRGSDDVFAVEDEIAGRVAESLELALAEPEHPFARFGTEAYLAFLQGRTLVTSSRTDDAEDAIERFSWAIELAPDFALAYVALADAHRHLGYLQAQGPGRSPLFIPLDHRAEPLTAGARRAAPLLAKAMQLDDSLGEAWVLGADLKAIAGEVAGAEADYRHGLALSPNYATGHEHFAEFLEQTGRREEAHAEYDKAIRLDPLAPRNYYRMGLMYIFSEATGAFSEQAEAYFLKTLELDPDYHLAMLRLGIILWYQGRFAEAVALAEQALAYDPRAHWMRWFLVEFYLELEEADAARSVLLEVGDGAKPLQWMALCWYAGEPLRAAELLRGSPPDRILADNDLHAYVLRDAALASRDPETGRRTLETLWDAELRDRLEPFRSVALAQLSVELGDSEGAEKFARIVLDHEDEPSSTPYPWRHAYPRAAAMTLQGRHDAALDLLEESFARGYRRRWWYAFERDPAFAPLHGNVRFQVLATRARDHAAAERAQLNTMRARGAVPVRTATRPLPPGAC